MVTQVVTEVVVLIGSSLGATSATLLPYWSKLREMQALGQTIHFEKKYVGTLLIAFIVGIVAAVLSFDDSIAKVDPTWSIVKIFIVSAVASATGNVTLNRFLSVSGVLTQLKGLQIENIRLRDKNSKLASLSSLNKI